MSRNLHRLAGGVPMRRREALAALPESRCTLHPARLAVAIVEDWSGQPSPVCGACADQGERLGYTVARPGEPS